MPAPSATERPKAESPTSLGGLRPFMRPYRTQIGLAMLFLVLAAVATLLFPVALRGLIDGGLVAGDPYLSQPVPNAMRRLRVVS